MTTRRQFLTYIGATAGTITVARYLTGCDPAADVVVSGDVASSGFTVPPGELWEFDPDVTTTVTCTGNAIVKGTLRMKPANPGVVHTLRFTGIDEADFVGGHTDTPLASDVGLWVMDGGKLDAQGTPKQGWNRTGTDSTWVSGDERITAPLLHSGAFTTYNGTVPQITAPDGTVHKSEVANLTRNVRIEGTATGRSHIQFLHTTTPQTLKYIAIRHMGPQQFTGVQGNGVKFWQVVKGRYGCHFHMDDDGSRGSLVEGCVVRDCGGPAFVAHLSNGITFADCVGYKTTDQCFWWDDDTPSDAITYDHCAAFAVGANLQANGQPVVLSVNGFHLNEGTNLTVRDSVAAGCAGDNVNAGGFHWPSAANNALPSEGGNSWIFHDNVAHANKCPAVSSWQNDPQHLHDHLVERFTAYGNKVGLLAGAYVNFYRYLDGSCFANDADMQQHVLGPVVFERCQFKNVSIRSHTIASTVPTKYLDCKIDTVNVNETNKAGVIEFHSTISANDLAPSDFTVVAKRSQITVYNSDGSSFTV